MDAKSKERMFSIDMRSKENVRSISISDVTQDRVLFEGYLGQLEELGMINGAILEVRGINGVLRMELSEDELHRMLSPKEEG